MLMDTLEAGEQSWAGRLRLLLQAMCHKRKVLKACQRTSFTPEELEDLRLILVFYDPVSLSVDSQIGGFVIGGLQLSGREQVDDDFADFRVKLAP